LIDAIFFPGERFVAAIYADNNLVVWNATTGAVAYQKPFATEVWRVGTSPNGQYAVIILSGQAIPYRIQNDPVTPAKQKRELRSSS
jgi:hypothetical protein